MQVSQLPIAIPAGDPFLTDVRVAVVSSLVTDQNPVDVAASSLHLSRRTFQRELAKRGTSFHALRDSMRQTIAMDLLRKFDISCADVARVLGYAHVTAFHRAFRRWTGMTPYAFAANEGKRGRSRRLEERAEQEPTVVASTDTGGVACQC